MKDGAYAVNTHECKSIGTQRIDFYANRDIWHTLIALVLKKFQKKFISNNNIITKFLRIQVYWIYWFYV